MSLQNPNNCQSCDHMHCRAPNGEDADGHCYMFKDSPTERCLQHTGNRDFERESMEALQRVILIINRNRQRQGRPCP